MTEGQPPKPTQRSKAASSGQIPHLGAKAPPPRPGSTTRINPEMTAAARENLFRQSPELKTMYDQIVADPLGQLHTLKSDKKDIGPGSDILQITVVDISGGDSGTGSVQAVDGLGQQGISM